MVYQLIDAMNPVLEELLYNSPTEKKSVISKLVKLLGDARSIALDLLKDTY